MLRGDTIDRNEQMSYPDVNRKRGLSATADERCAPMRNACRSLEFSVALAAMSALYQVSVRTHFPAAQARRVAPRACLIDPWAMTVSS
jgi:hypothetical protein